MSPGDRIVAYPVGGTVRFVTEDGAQAVIETVHSGWKDGTGHFHGKFAILDVPSMTLGPRFDLLEAAQDSIS